MRLANDLGKVAFVFGDRFWNLATPEDTIDPAVSATTTRAKVQRAILSHCQIGDIERLSCSKDLGFNFFAGALGFGKRDQDSTFGPVRKENRVVKTCWELNVLIKNRTGW